MNRPAPAPVRHGSLSLLAWALLALPLLSCFEPASVLCPSGLVCPEGQLCAANQNVCLKTPCGNGVVEADEACDDGNILDGDGCAKDCSSDERCGNNKIDLAAGEVCD